MIELKPGKKHMIIKRDGRMEQYNEEKMRKVLRWAITRAFEKGVIGKQLNVDLNSKFTQDMIENMINEVLDDTKIKIYDKIKIEKLFDTVINTVENKISRLQPIWSDVATSLLVQKYYKERWSIKRDEYPPYSIVIKKGIQYKYYDDKIWKKLTDEDIEKLENMIDPSRDFNILAYGLKAFMKKYAFPNELPQHSIMRLAYYAFHNEEDKELMFKLIKDRYDMINKIISAASPLWLSSGAPNAQIASCVLTAMEDDSWSINRTLNNLGLYSKWGGGTACDVSKLRCKGSLIGKTGRSSGIIPFIKDIESIIKSYNQRGLRNGACAVYNNWWHYEIEDFLMLKDEGGSEDNRARSLQYGIKLNRLFIERVIKDEELCLFDPKETPELLESYGEEFKKWYEHYEEKAGIRKKKIKARDLAYLISKIRAETGNLYIFFSDNVNENTPYNLYINSANLCVEIMLPSRGSTLKNEYIDSGLNNKNIEIKQEINPGLISLCNLSSINISEWMKLDKKIKERYAYNLCRAMDNMIDTAFYPAKEGEISNKLYRPIGIGSFNLAGYFAEKDVSYKDKESLKIEFDAFEDIYYHLFSAANQLAKERGPFAKFYESKWNKGWLPIDYFKDEFLKWAEDWQIERWKKLREDIKNYGIRFAVIGAIAPTASSSNIFEGGATESINPVKNIIATKTGTLHGKLLVPNIVKYGMNYDICWDILNSVLLKHAQIRQIFLDQGQSIDLFYEEPDSAFEFFKDISTAEKLGLKSLYYANIAKATEKEVCESCSS